MRILALSLMLGSLVLLTGCDAFARQDGDAYEAAGTTPAQFDADNQDCRIEAGNYVSYDLKGMSGTSYDRNRAFNRIYGRCMRSKGYRPRPYIENLFPGIGPSSTF